MARADFAEAVASMGLRYLDYSVSVEESVGVEESSLMEMLGRSTRQFGPRLHPPQRLGLGLRALAREADLGEAEGPRGHTCSGDRRGCALAA